MAITYRDLRELMIDRKIQWQDIHSEVGISWGTIAKFNKDEYVTLSTIEKIATYLGCDIGDLVSIKK